MSEEDARDQAKTNPGTTVWRWTTVLAGALALSNMVSDLVQWIEQIEAVLTASIASSRLAATLWRAVARSSTSLTKSTWYLAPGGNIDFVFHPRFPKRSLTEDWQMGRP